MALKSALKRPQSPESPISPSDGVPRRRISFADEVPPPCPSVAASDDNDKDSGSLLLGPEVLKKWMKMCFEDQLVHHAQKNSIPGLDSFGGADGLLRSLRTDLKSGIRVQDVESRRATHGSNFLPQDDPDPMWLIAWEALQDPSLVFLCIAALVSFVVGILFQQGMEWIEGLAILSAVLVVVTVTAVNDYQKDQQFRALNDAKEDVQVMVVRDGRRALISKHDLVVGDVVLLGAGDVVPADGVTFHKNDLGVSEKMLTGEVALKQKGPFRLDGGPEDPVAQSPAIFAGTCIEEGEGTMVVTAVGRNTYQGGIQERMDHDESAKSVLQAKLDDMTDMITRGGAVAGALTVAVLLVRFVLAFVWKACCKEVWDNSIHNLEWLRFFVTGVTVFVVAVPEGLPLAVTIALAFSVKKMMSDSNLVRHLSACETMGSATTICSDKTGTLTTGRMTVVRIWCAGVMGGSVHEAKQDNFRGLPEKLKKFLSHAVVINTSFKSDVECDEQGKVVMYRGNDTECAMLLLANEILQGGLDYRSIRDKFPMDHPQRCCIPFTSERKAMSTIVPFQIQTGEEGEVRTVFRMFTTGAADLVLGKCSSMLSAHGAQSHLEFARPNIVDQIDEFSKASLRTLAVAYRDFDETPKVTRTPSDYEFEKELTFIALIGMEDHIRQEVPRAVRACQDAGIVVRMITGDDSRTARSIAIKCGIIKSEHGDGGVMTGQEFRSRVSSRGSDEVVMDEFDKIWPTLRVLARSTPTDKLMLVSGAQASRASTPQTVAVTGDGSNDAPALKRADVGFAMGISGTQVAQRAADIIIMDDNFASIVQAVKWGRCVYDNICKFLQFQLTVNLSACFIAVVGASILTESPLNVIQLLWINMIMDSLASLALATEDPSPSLLTRAPYPRDQPLLSRRMLRFMIGHGIWQILVLAFLIFQIGDVCQMGATQDICENGTLVTDMFGGIRSGRPTMYDQSMHGLNVSCTAPMNHADNNTYTYGNNGTMAAVKSADWCHKVVQVENLPTQHYTIVFTCFVMLQWFNQINARKIHGEVNVFAGIFENRFFLYVMAMELVLQFIMVQVPGINTAMGCMPLDVWQWLLCIFIGLTSIPINMLICCISPEWMPTWTISWQKKAKEKSSWEDEGTRPEDVPLLPLSLDLDPQTSSSSPQNGMTRRTSLTDGRKLPK